MWVHEQELSSLLLLLLLLPARRGGDLLLLPPRARRVEPLERSFHHTQRVVRRRRHRLGPRNGHGRGGDLKLKRTFDCNSTILELKVLVALPDGALLDIEIAQPP